MKEYIIWGKTNPTQKEQILLTKLENNPITSEIEARKALRILETKYSCTECRIQEIDLTYPNSLNKLFIQTLKK